MQGFVEWWQPETGIIIKDFEWGYEKGKEFIDGVKYQAKTRDTSRSEIKYSFDGQSQFHFRHTSGADDSRGRIGSYDPQVWNGNMTPAILLGYGLNWWGKQSLADFLSTADELKVSNTKTEIDGQACVLIEAIGLSYKSPKGNTFSYDVKAWIDTERDFRPLKIEKYEHAEVDRTNPGQGRWEKLVRRIDNIKLEQFGGTWFPVSGDRQMFTNTIEGPEGMSKEEFEKMYMNKGYTEEEFFERGILRHVNKPTSAKRRIKITNIRINEGIPLEKFKVQFPENCSVWDEFLQTGYTVGNTGVKHLLEIDENTLNNDAIKTTIATVQSDAAVDNKEVPKNSHASPEDEVNSEVEAEESVIFSIPVIIVFALFIIIVVVSVFIFKRNVD
jgi:hypothetical protein